MIHLAKLWGDDVSNEIETFNDVPTKLKQNVADYLIENGHEDLVPVEEDII